MWEYFRHTVKAAVGTAARFRVCGEAGKKQLQPDGWGRIAVFKGGITMDSLNPTLDAVTRSVSIDPLRPVTSSSAIVFAGHLIGSSIEPRVSSAPEDGPNEFQLTQKHLHCGVDDTGQL